jgi:peroxiredoxin (alkyl hydroperoxide reductase subunit C)
MPLAIGTKAPDFTLYDQNRDRVSLSYLAGHNSLIVFIPFPFTGHCDNEGCAIRDGLGGLESIDAKVVVITDHAVPVNAKWSADNGFEFPVLSDFWPHGDVTRAYRAFNNDLGVANRVTYVIDANGIVQQVIATDSLGIPREYELYGQALAAL